MGGCTLCPRMCGADREHGEFGFCGMPAEIYAARETNTVGISSKDLADQIPGAEYYKTFDEITQRLREIAAPGDLILTIGAGDIYLVGEALAKEQA